MSSSNPNKVPESYYVRLNGWNNRVYTYLLNWLAAGLARVALLWRGKTRQRFEGTARFLRNLAFYIGRPETARLMAEPQFLRQAVGETLWLASLIAVVTVWTFLSVYGFMLIPLIPATLLVAALTFLITHLLYLLALSGDAYRGVQDEGQRQVAYQASSFALRFAGGILIVLSLCLAFVAAWRTWAAIDLSLLVLATRVIYLARLAHLRWAVLAIIPLEDEGEALAEQK